MDLKESKLLDHPDSKEENESGTSDTKRNMEYSNKAKAMMAAHNEEEPNLSKVRLNKESNDTSLKYRDPDDMLTRPMNINLQIINRDDPAHSYSGQSKNVREDEASDGHYSNKNDNNEALINSPQIREDHRYSDGKYGFEMNNSYSLNEFDSLNVDLYSYHKKTQQIMGKLAECLHT